MRFLPLFCALATIAWASAAPAPVDSEHGEDLKQLTLDTFKSSTAKGLWLVEHFSPYCPHCRNFEPTWRRLTEDFKTAEVTSHFYMAQVNCITQGDLCQANGIKFYPQIKLYVDGVEKETYENDRSPAVLSKYITDQIQKYVAQVGQEAAPPANQVVIGRKLENVNPHGAVTVLTPSNFKSVVEEGPVFIKFYAPWCGHCKRLAPTWIELASKLKNVLNIAEVNCDEHGKLCKQEGIDGYPMLYLYNADHKVEYRGSRKIENMEAYGRKAVSSGLKTVDLSTFNDVARNEKVVYLYLRTIGTSSYDISKVEDAAKPLLGDPPVVQSQDPALWKHLGQDPSRGPVLLAVHHDEITASFNVDPTTPVQSISQWLVENKLPLSDELTTENFQSVMKSESGPLVVLVALDTEKRTGSALQEDTGALNQMAKAWHAGGKKINGRSVVFVWMDGVTWGKWLKGMYGIKQSAMPAVVIADHEQLVYYDLDTNRKPIAFDGPTIHRSLEAIASGHLTPKHSENFIERWMRSIHDRLNAFESYFATHPLRSLGILAVIISLVVMGLWKLVQMDVEPMKRQRLD